MALWSEGERILATIPRYTGRDLKAIRTRLRLTQWEVADLLEISRPTLYRIEKEARELTPPVCLLVEHLRSYAAD